MVFQGNPRHYDIDRYLSRQTFVYWMCKRFQDQMQLGMPAFIKRSGPNNGIIALGSVAELPKAAAEVERPDLLGADLWSEPQPKDGPKIGIQLEEVRLTLGEGMIPWSEAVHLPSLAEHPIVNVRTGGVFRLSAEQAVDVFRAWGNDTSVMPSTATAGREGNRLEVRHFRFERNRRLVRDKKRLFLEEHGRLACEVCGFRYGQHYPLGLADGFIEVHHLKPLAELDGAVVTSVDDLVCICANCHRMIHRSGDVDSNFHTLVRHFSK